MTIYFVLFITGVLWLFFSRLIYKYDKGFSLRKWVWVKLFRREDLYKEIPKEEKIEISAYISAADLFGILFACSIVFSFFQIWLQLTVSKSPGMVIANVELLAHSIRDKIRIFNINPWLDGMLIYVLLALPALLPITKYLSLSDHYQKFCKWVSRATRVFALFTSFTFFGIMTRDKVKETADDLEVHSFELIEDNKLIHQQIYSEIEDQIADAFLQLPEITQVLNNLESCQSLFQQAKNNEDIVEYNSHQNDAAKVSLDLKAHEITKTMDWGEVLSGEDTRVGSEYASLQTSQKDWRFTDIVKDIETNSFFKENEIWIRTHVSENSTKKVKAKLKHSAAPIVSKHFEKYSPAIKKIFKAGYKKVIKEGFNSLTNNALQEYPFLGILVDIFIHDPIKDKLWQKVEPYFVAAHDNIQTVRDDALVKAAEPFVIEINEQKKNYAIQLNKLKSDAEVLLQASQNEVQSTIANIRAVNDQVRRYAEALLVSHPYSELKLEYRPSRNDPPYSISVETSNLPTEAEWENSIMQNRYDLYQNKIQDVRPLFHKIIREAEAEKFAQRLERQFVERAARLEVRKAGFRSIMKRVVRRIRIP
jgi:hypothetical protein